MPPGGPPFVPVADPFEGLAAFAASLLVGWLAAMRFRYPGGWVEAATTGAAAVVVLAALELLVPSTPAPTPLAPTSCSMTVSTNPTRLPADGSWLTS